jgi:hypothetical protein
MEKFAATLTLFLAQNGRVNGRSYDNLQPSRSMVVVASDCSAVATGQNLSDGVSL